VLGRGDLKRYAAECERLAVGGLRMSPIRKAAPILPTLAVLGTLVGCDHATKLVAKAALESAPPRAVIDSVLDLRYVENTDVAFNLLRWIPEAVRRPLLTVFGALAIAGLLALAVSRRLAGACGAALVLILAGAFGNYQDRLCRGYVIDFIHVAHWPVFNVADILVTLGVALFALASVRHRTGVTA
jgi:signal peptidase II